MCLSYRDLGSHTPPGTRLDPVGCLLVSRSYLYISFIKWVYSSGSGFPVHSGGFLRNASLDTQHTRQLQLTALVHRPIVLACSLAHLAVSHTPPGTIFDLAGCLLLQSMRPFLFRSITWCIQVAVVSLITLEVSSGIHQMTHSTQSNNR